MSFVVAALYKFAPFPDFQDWRAPLTELGKTHDLCGTLLLAPEGINGTVAGPRAGIDALLAFIKADPRFADLGHKESTASIQPFYRLKVRLKKEIVTLGVPGVEPATRMGVEVAPQDWNALIQDPEVILIDTRNTYEIAIGTFKGAVDPKTETFRAFPKFVQETLTDKRQKIAMYCTGGIRCEKASSYLLDLGYENVYQLKGGILKYLEEIPQAESTWIGECFVFDRRVGVETGMREGAAELCFGCRNPLDAGAKETPEFEEGVSCPRCFEKTSDAKKVALRERQHQIQLARARGEHHLGAAHLR